MTQPSYIPVGPNTKRERVKCPDCGHRRMTSIVAGIVLACDECQEKRQARLKEKPADNWTSRENVNRLMRNGFDQFAESVDDNGDLALVKGKGDKYIRIAEVIFIREDGYSVGALHETAMFVYMMDPNRWVGILVKPSPDVLDPRVWLKRTAQVAEADEQDSFQNKIPRKKDKKRGNQ